MTIERKIANLFHLSDKNWMRHANPWSVWTRYTVLPLLALAFWSRVWIGWWCFVPVIITFLWLFLNPILFKAPVSNNSWATKAVLGERIYTHRDKTEIPTIHQTNIFKILNGITLFGFVYTIWAVYNYYPLELFYGIVITYLGKSWYLDRMVLLFEMMNPTSEFPS